MSRHFPVVFFTAHGMPGEVEDTLETEEGAAAVLHRKSQGRPAGARLLVTHRLFGETNKPGKHS